MSLRKRLPTAFVLLILFFLVVQFVHPFGYFVVLQILILASLFEFYNLFRYRKLFPEKILGVVLALTISLSFYFEEIPLEIVLFGCLFLTAIYFVISFNTVEKLVQFPSSIALTFFGAVYLSFTLN